MGTRATLFPSSEVIIELVVGNNHILPDPFDAIDIREEPVKDGPYSHVQYEPRAKFELIPFSMCFWYHVGKEKK